MTDAFTTTYHRLRDDLLAGRVIRILDVARNERPEAIAAIAVLRDELPVRMSWRTVSESHLTETRLRARCYWIPGEHLPELREAMQ